MRSNKYYNQQPVINKEVRKVGPISSETIQADTLAFFEAGGHITDLGSYTEAPYIGQANNRKIHADVRG